MITASKAHPKSYRPDLPLPTVYQTYTENIGGQRVAHATRSLTAWADKVTAEHARRTKPAPADRIGTSRRAHPRSYRPDLPLRGYSCAELVRPTAEDKAYWEAHPLKYDPASTAPRFPDAYGRPLCGCEDKRRRREWREGY